MKEMLFIKKLLSATLLCLALCACIMSCGSSDNIPDETQAEDETAFVDYTKEDDTPFVNIPYDMSLLANLYLTTDESCPSRIYLSCNGGRLYIGEVLFDQVSYEENIEVKYAPIYDYHTTEVIKEDNGTLWLTEGETEILTLMKRIAQQKNCYLLKSSVENDYADYIAAYYIDEVCYLVFFNEEGIAFCIYSMEAEYAEPNFTDGMEIYADCMANLHGIGDMNVKLNVEDGQIYKYGYLYKIQYCNDFKIDIEYCRENMHFWRTNETGSANSKPNQTHEDVQNAGIRLLERMNEQHGFFMLCSTEEAPYEERLAVFLIDGEYYFIDITKPYERIGKIWIICGTENYKEEKQALY